MLMDAKMLHRPKRICRVGCFCILTMLNYFIISVFMYLFFSSNVLNSFGIRGLSAVSEMSIECIAIRTFLHADIGIHCQRPVPARVLAVHALIHSKSMYSKIVCAYCV